ncbi:MAG: hypothetical protein WCZ28_11420 [Burkholderiaceae bacterium]
MEHVRTRGWESALADYLAAHRAAVFAWGDCDCVLFAAGAVAAMTGSDPAAEVRGRYRTRIGAMRKLRGRGWASLEGMMDAHFAQVPPAFAQRGDIVMANGSLGVCIGRTALFVGEEGGAPELVSLPLASWSQAWRVPHG